MMQQIKPIKRSKELAPLSRDHHEGLLFVWKIRQGIKKGIAPVRMAQYAGWFWENHLQEHFEKEEQSFAPVLSAGHPAMLELMDEHEGIEAK